MTDKLREAAQQALDYIRSTADYKMGRPPACEAVLDLVDALAEPQEPVADDRLQRIYDSATHAAAMAVFMTRMDAEQPDADDMGVSGWLQEAEDRVKRRATQSLKSLIYTAPQPAKPAQAVVQVPPNNDLELLLRQVFAFCEATEDATEVEPKNEHQRGFDKGRRFEAKQIRRSIGDWFQAEFCGRSFMGEPVVAAAPEAPQPAKRVPLTDDEWFEFWDNCQAIPGDSGFPEFLQIARAIERAHGITGETQ